jgi:hypothetical protein
VLRETIAGEGNVNEVRMSPRRRESFARATRLLLSPLVAMIDYYVDSARRIVVTRVTGRISFGDFANHLQRLYRDPKFAADFSALIVATHSDAIPTEESLALIRPLLRLWSTRRAGAKWAFVLPDNHTRTFAESALLDLRLTAVVTRCFISEAAALGWLEAVPEPARV